MVRTAPSRSRFLELAVGQFNRIEVGSVRWQVAECGSNYFDGRKNAMRLVTEGERPRFVLDAARAQNVTPELL